MELIELAAKHWKEMQVAEREKLLRELELTAHDLGGYSIAEASEISEFNLLPLIVRGCLFTAIIPNGFSVEERIARLEKMKKCKE